MSPERLKILRTAVLVVVVVLAALLGRWGGSGGQEVGGGSVERAFADRASDVEVVLAGEVDRVLADDREGSRHQRFIVRLASGQTVLVAHNIDLAERAPLRRGDAVEIKGEYEWNERGGVVHWTHHDPQGRRRGGWIRHQGREYR